MKRPWLEMLGLLMPEPAIDVAALEQLDMPADVVDPAAVEHENRVGAHQRRQAVRDDEEGALFGDAQHIGVYDPFVFGAECTSPLFEDQHSRTPEECPCYRQPLALP